MNKLFKCIGNPLEQMNKLFKRMNKTIYTLTCTPRFPGFQHNFNSIGHSFQCPNTCSALFYAIQKHPTQALSNEED